MLYFHSSLSTLLCVCSYFTAFLKTILLVISHRLLLNSEMIQTNKTLSTVKLPLHLAPETIS
jgi:hypothetical protein